MEPLTARVVARMHPMSFRSAITRLAPLAGALGLFLFAGVVPSRAADQPVRLVVPYTPGSGPDMAARLIADKLTALVGGSMLVDNRPGASGTIGTAAVARAAPDGLTLLVAPTTHVITAAVRKLPYDPIADFAPIVEFSRGSFVVIVPSSSPARTLVELVQLLKAADGQAAYSSAGIASTVHLFTEALLRATHVKARHIPSKGVSGAMMDVLQAQVDFTLTPVSLALPQIKSGKMRVLAQTTRTRSKLIPDVPTMSEAGYPGFEATVWLGLYAPTHTPPATVAKLNRALNALLARPDVLQSLAQNGMEPAGGTPEQFAALNKADLARFTAVAKSANITAD